MRVWVCGARGSTPAPGPEFVRYGGHTSCLAVAAGDGPPTLLLDAGTGIRNVTSLLAGSPFQGTILLTHLHWDHVHGLPFFAAGDRDGARVDLHLPAQPDGSTAAEALARGMSPPHFPIGPHQLRGEWSFDNLSPGCHQFGDFQVDALEVPHKGGVTFGFRVSGGGRALAYIPDHCPTEAGPGPEGWGEYHHSALALARDVDLLVHDAHLLVDELEAESSFGHAAANYVLGLGERAGARRALFFHHKPTRTDVELDRLAADLGAELAVEGSVLDL